MNDRLFSLKTEFFVGLTTHLGNTIWYNDAIKDITYILGKNKINSFTITEATHFCKGQSEKAIIITLMHESKEPQTDDSLAEAAKKYDEIAERLRSNFQLSELLTTHTEVAAKLVKKEGSDV